MRFFALQGRHIAPMGVKFGMAVVGPPKLAFLLRFYENVEYKRPTGAYPLRDFHIICEICIAFQDALAVKISLDLLEGLWSYVGFKLMVSGFCQIFSVP